MSRLNSFQSFLKGRWLTPQQHQLIEALLSDHGVHIDTLVECYNLLGLTKGDFIQHSNHFNLTLRRGVLEALQEAYFDAKEDTKSYNVQTQPQQTSMNNAYLVTLANEDVKLVAVQFDDSHRHTDENYTYMTTLDLKVDDEVIVQTRSTLKTARVTAVDLPIPDEKDPVFYRWVVSIADSLRAKSDRLDRYVTSLRERYDRIKQEAHRRQLRAALGLDAPNCNLPTLTDDVDSDKPSC